MKKLRVGIIYGGRSAEHEVSILSACNVIKALDTKKYVPVLMRITKQGGWYLEDKGSLLLAHTKSKNALMITPGSKKTTLVPSDGVGHGPQVDVVFPVLHGPYGEDGTVQGLLKLLNVPFVGSSVLGSAVAMDKEVAKRLMASVGIDIAEYIVMNAHTKVSYEKVVRKLGKIVFVKPANLGSSVGVSKVRNKKEYDNAIKDAFRFDTKILVEEYIQGRELECGVLGNDDPKCSLVGEIIPHDEFYSYDAKYIDENGAELVIPAKLSPLLQKKIQSLALRAFKVACCEGMARVDFFMSKKRIVVNEVNTIPGFTDISMYPLLWKASGVSYSKLVTQLITLAIERFNNEKVLLTSRT